MNQAFTDTRSFHPVTSMSLRNRLLSITIWFSACVMPLFFGAVHPELYLPIYAAVFLLAGASLLQLNNRIEAWPHELPLTTKLFTVFGAFLAYLLANGAIRLFFSQSHPILGSVSLLYTPHEYFNSWFTIAASFAFLSVVTCSLYLRVVSAESLIRLISISGLMVSVVALMHWFYDNGKLFWMFSPDHIFVSDRARWPYVSSNNLGHHLILTLFPTVYLLIRGVRNLFKIIDTLAARRPISILDLVNTPGVQVKMLRIVFDLFTVLSITLGILASQSRGTWIGACVGGIGYLWLDRTLQKAHESKNPNDSFESLRDRRRKTRPLEGVTFFDTFLYLIRKLSFAFGIVIAGVLLLLFLRDRGLEMVLNRAEYGLLSSKDDIRWVMYQNTLPMIMSNPLFGVGLGAWNLAIGQYIDPSLARLNPVYLHSDPMQLLAETGILGVSFVIYLAFSVLRHAVKSLFIFGIRDSQKVLCLTWSLISLLIGSFFDFPFRIPSIAFLFVLTLSALCFTIDSNQELNRTSSTD